MNDAQSNQEFDRKRRLSVYEQWIDMFDFFREQLKSLVPEDAVFLIEYDSLKVLWKDDLLLIYRIDDKVYIKDLARLRLNEMLPEIGDGTQIGYPIAGWKCNASICEDIKYCLSWMVPEAVAHAEQWWAAHWATDDLIELGKRR